MGAMLGPKPHGEIAVPIPINKPDSRTACQPRPNSGVGDTYVTGGTAQVVQLDHDQFVPGVEKVYDPGQFIATVPAFAAGLFGANNLAPFGPKPRFLQGAVLIGG